MGDLALADGCAMKRTRTSFMIGLFGCGTTVICHRLEELQIAS